MLRKCLRKPMGFLAMVFGRQHACYDSHFRTGEYKLAHQLSGQASVEIRFDAYNARTAAFRGIGGYTNDPNTLAFGLVDQRGKTLRVPCGQNDSIDTAGDEFL